MRDANTIEADGGVGSEIPSIDLSKLLGFQHIAVDMVDEGFLEATAATFNKIGGPGEGPIILEARADR